MLSSSPSSYTKEKFVKEALEPRDTVRQNQSELRRGHPQTCFGDTGKEAMCLISWPSTAVAGNTIMGKHINTAFQPSPDQKVYNFRLLILTAR